MRCLFAAVIFSLLAVPLSADDRLDIRVLYCGDPGAAREADFRSFLEKHFTKVTVADLSKFKEVQTKAQDVVIFDWTPIYDGKRDLDTKRFDRLSSAEPELSQGFARPVILIGAAAGTITRKGDRKIDWLCLCLSDKAHKLALDHVLFHAPLEVNPRLEEIPTPEDYADMTIDSSIGEKMKIWRVQTKDYPEVDPGLVSTLYGFADSPDAEVIAQGLAGKGPDTVALGRQANFFLWGFSAPPADMTPAGQRLFVNVVAYMRQFGGQIPLVRPKARSREWALRYAIIPRELSEDAERRDRLGLTKMLAENPTIIPKDFKGDSKTLIASVMEKHHNEKTREMASLLPISLRIEFGMNSDKYVAYYKENLEYLRPGGDGTIMFGVLDVDEDAKAIKSSNRRIEMLDRCVSMLEKNDRPELALRLLKRYTEANFDTASQWRAWLNTSRSQLFFSDVGGYKFFLDNRPILTDNKR
jgi:hypothetical protein